MKQIKLEFERPCEPYDLVIANALLTQLMVQISQIGIRVDDPKNKNDAIIEMENKNGKTN